MSDEKSFHYVRNVAAFSHSTKILSSQFCRTKTVKRGGGRLCCTKYISHAFEHTAVCIYDNNLLGTVVYVKVLKEGESQHRVAVFFCY